VSNQKISFFDFVMLSMGVLIGLLVGVVFFVRMAAIDTQGDFAVSDPEVQAEISERLQPVGRVVLLGSAELLAAASLQAAPAQVETVLSGAQVYNAACYLCHAAPGIGGAPVIGDTEAWTARIEQGMEMLQQHAIDGFQGSTGVMPAKGGRIDLSDTEIISGVEFMVEQAVGE
jgi:cytochrome c5